MTDTIKKESPVEATSDGILITWKTVILFILCVLGVTGGAPALTAYLGIGGSKVSAEQFLLHEQAQTNYFTGVDRRINTCEDAIGKVTTLLEEVARAQRTQIANDSAVRLVAAIRNPSRREQEFVRIFQLNYSRLSQATPLPVCFNLECRE